jgi:hypothetical protein
LNYASARAPRVSHGAYEQQLDRGASPKDTPEAEPTEADHWTPSVSAEPIPTSLSAEQSDDVMQALGVSLGGESANITLSGYEDEAWLKQLPQTSTDDR